MELCSSGHDEVCFEGRHCPACLLADEYKGQINDLESKVENLEKDIAALENQ